jgi:hypothetical protein
LLVPDASYILQAELKQLHSVSDLQHCINPRNEAAALALLVSSQQGELLMSNLIHWENYCAAAVVDVIVACPKDAVGLFPGGSWQHTCT